MTSDVTLRGLRTARGLTQREVAEQAGLDRSVYNALENGRPGRPFSEHYARALEPVLGWDVWQLITLPAAENGPAEIPEPSFGTVLRALAEQVAGRDADAAAFLERLLILETAADRRTKRLDEHDDQLQAIHGRLDALEAAVETLELRLSPPSTGDAQG